MLLVVSCALMCHYKVSVVYYFLMVLFVFCFLFLILSFFSSFKFWINNVKLLPELKHRTYHRFVWFMHDCETRDANRPLLLLYFCFNVLLVWNPKVVIYPKRGDTRKLYKQWENEDDQETKKKSIERKISFFAYYWIIQFFVLFCFGQQSE